MGILVVFQTTTRTTQARFPDHNPKTKETAMIFDEEFKSAIEKALDDGVVAQRKKDEIRRIMSEFTLILSNILTKRYNLPITVDSQEVVIRETPSFLRLMISAPPLPEREQPIIAVFDELRLSYNDANHHYSKRICKFTIDVKSGYPCKIEYGQTNVFCHNADEIKSAVLSMVQDLGAFFNEIEGEIKTKVISQDSTNCSRSDQ